MGQDGAAIDEWIGFQIACQNDLFNKVSGQSTWGMSGKIQP
jgi:hypothetical protein